jgi:hypothetical protein
MRSLILGKSQLDYPTNSFVERACSERLVEWAVGVGAKIWFVEAGHKAEL